MSSEVRDNRQVATDRLRSEFSVVALRNYSAFEFAREALAEFGVILTITEADKLLRENREIKEQAFVSLIPRVERGLSEQVVNDALKRLDAEWETLSSQLWRAWKFGEESLDVMVRSDGEIATHNSAVTTSPPGLFIFGTTSQPGHQEKNSQHQEQGRKHGYDGVKKKKSSQRQEQARKHGYSSNLQCNANVMGYESTTANDKEVQMPKPNASTMPTGDGSNKVPQEHGPRVCDEGVIHEPDGLSNANVMGSESDKEVQVPKPNPSTRATGDGSQEHGPRAENVDELVDGGVILQDSNDDAEVVDDDWVNVPDANVKLDPYMEISSFKAILEEQRKALDLVKELEQHVQNAQVQRAHLAVQTAYDEVQRAHDEAAHKLEQLALDELH